MPVINKYINSFFFFIIEKKISHLENKGPGKAFATAFQYLAPKLREKDWLVTMEGDNTSRLEILKQMFTRTEEGYEVILASPFMYPGAILQTTFIRVFLSFIANNLFKGMLGIQGILTISSFYRLYHGSIFLKLQSCYGEEIIERKGFESMVFTSHGTDPYPIGRGIKYKQKAGVAIVGWVRYHADVHAD